MRPIENFTCHPNSGDAVVNVLNNLNADSYGSRGKDVKEMARDARGKESVYDAELYREMRIDETRALCSFEYSRE